MVPLFFGVHSSFFGANGLEAVVKHLKMLGFNLQNLSGSQGLHPSYVSTTTTPRSSTAPFLFFSHNVQLLNGGEKCKWTRHQKQSCVSSQSGIFHPSILASLAGNQNQPGKRQEHTGGSPHPCEPIARWEYRLFHTNYSGTIPRGSKKKIQTPFLNYRNS